MNTQQKLQYPYKNKVPVVFDVSFNTDQSCFAIGCETGFIIYSTDPIERRTVRDFSKGDTTNTRKAVSFEAMDQDMDLVDSESNNEQLLASLPHGKGVGLVKMLLKTNYIAIVGGGKVPLFSTNKLSIWDDLKGKSILKFEFPTPILNCGISKKHIIVALKSQVVVYSFSMKPKLISRFDTIDNNEAVLEVSLNDDSVKIAFPARTVGQIQLLDFSADSSVEGNLTIIKAHKSRVQSIKISKSGKIMASASETGTLIRIHDTKSGALMFEFRRGLDKVKITSMAFSNDDSLLAVLSDKNTLHVFRLKSSPNSNKTHALNNIPVPLPSYFHSTWSFVSGSVGPESNINDIGQLGWADEFSIVIIWKVRAIWEKWSIIWEESSTREDKGLWRIVKNGWKGLGISKG